MQIPLDGSGPALFVGNTDAALDPTFLSRHAISAIINLTDKTIDHDDIDVFSFILPSQDLLDAEMPKTCAKLTAITSDIVDLHRHGRPVLIACADGRNKSVLTAGYYWLMAQNTRRLMTTDAGGRPIRIGPADAISRLEMLYFTPSQVTAEVADRQLLAGPPEVIDQRMVALGAAGRAQLEACRASRRAKICLTMATFGRLLRSVAKNIG